MLYERESGWGAELHCGMKQNLNTVGIFPLDYDTAVNVKTQTQV